MREISPLSQQLFVLGDLFDAWIGDDCLSLDSSESEFYRMVVNEFSNYSNQGKDLFFIHGNRDFLLSSDFAKKAGGKILEEPYTFYLDNKKIAFIHGDILCTDDVEYIKFRQMVRAPLWQKEFLSKSIEERLIVATQLREKSMLAQKEKSSEIMDVNQNAVDEFIVENDLDWLIHGHTHRQNIHLEEIDNKKAKRIVLADWGEKGFYLSISKGKLEEKYFS